MYSLLAADPLIETILKASILLFDNVHHFLQTDSLYIFFFKKQTFYFKQSGSSGLI